MCGCGMCTQTQIVWLLSNTNNFQMYVINRSKSSSSTAAWAHVLALFLVSHTSATVRVVLSSSRLRFLPSSIHPLASVRFSPLCALVSRYVATRIYELLPLHVSVNGCGSLFLSIRTSSTSPRTSSLSNGGGNYR